MEKKTKPKEEFTYRTPFILLFLFIVLSFFIGLVYTNPQLSEFFSKLFFREKPSVCYIENELKNFISLQAKEHTNLFPYAGLESGFKISYQTIANYSVCYTGNFVCKKEDNLFHCKAVIMPFEVFCFKNETAIICVKSFVIDSKSLEVVSISCEPAPRQIESYC